MKDKKIEEKKKIDYRRLNEILNTGDKILKIAYIFFIIIAIYTLTLITKEWTIFTFILKLLKILTPFFIGLVLAWLLDPAVRYLQQKKMNRILGTSLIFVIIIAIIYLVFNSMIPILFNQINEFIQSLPGILDDIVVWFNNIFKGLKSTEFINFENIRVEAISSIETLITTITTKLPSTLINFVKNMFSTLGVFVLGLMIGFYLLFDFDNSERVVFAIIPKKFREDVKKLLKQINTALVGFVKGTLVTSTLIFVLSTLVFSIVGLKAPILFGLICGVTNIIPYIGPYLGAIPALIVGFSQGTGTGILIGVLLLVIQTIEGNFIHPLVMSKTMKLHPVTILISLLVFEHFFGIIGMIIAAPVVSIIKIIYSFFREKYSEFKKTRIEG